MKTEGKTCNHSKEETKLTKQSKITLRRERIDFLIWALSRVRRATVTLPPHLCCFFGVVQGTTTCRRVLGWASTTSTKQPNGLATVTRRKPSRSTTEQPCVCTSCRCCAISQDGRHPSAWQLSVLSPTLTLPERFYVLDARVFWPPHLCLWTLLGASGAQSLLCWLTHISSVCKDLFAQHAIFVWTLWGVCSPCLYLHAKQIYMH